MHISFVLIIFLVGSGVSLADLPCSVQSCRDLAIEKHRFVGKVP